MASKTHKLTNVVNSHYYEVHTVRPWLREEKNATDIVTNGLKVNLSTECVNECSLFELQVNPEHFSNVNWTIWM